MNGWAIAMLVSGGLFSGGVVVFAWERVPVWRSLPVAEFRKDFAVTIRRADRVQPALLVASIVATIGFAIGATGAARTLAVLGAAGFIATLVVSGALLVPLQRRIITASETKASSDEVMRRRWFRGHLGRSILGVACFAVVAVAATL
jgi:hypothetical protein